MPMERATALVLRTTDWSASLAVQAGKKYPITMEYYESAGSALATLSWSSPTTVKSIIPQSQLYPNYQAGFVSVARVLTNGQFNLLISGLVGKGYVLQASTNLTAWVSIQTNVPSPNPNTTLPINLLNFSDTLATNYSRRFYRTVQLP